MLPPPDATINHVISHYLFGPVVSRSRTLPGHDACEPFTDMANKITLTPASSHGKLVALEDGKG